MIVWSLPSNYYKGLSGGVETVNARYPERKQERACIFSLFPSLVVTATSIIWWAEKFNKDVFLLATPMLPSSHFISLMGTASWNWLKKAPFKASKCKWKSHFWTALNFSELWNQVLSLDHFVFQNYGDFLCSKYKEVVCFYVSNLRQ